MLAAPLHAAPTSEAWQPPGGLRQWPLWPGRAPDMPAPPAAAETTFRVDKGARSYTGIANVTTPTFTVFPPSGRNSGAAMVVFPGGGFQILAMDIEGTEACAWVTAHGMTCVLVKYRVPAGNHHWDKACKCHVTPPVPFALQDAQRAIRLVRARAAALGINPRKVGVMGFSAGGYLVAQTSNIVASTYRPVDAADALDSRPDFAVALYPGHLCRAGGTLDPGLHVSARTPPTFLLQAWDDPVDDVCNSLVYARALRDAGVAPEVHLFATGGHAFGLRNDGQPISAWPALLERWLHAIGMLD